MSASSKLERRIARAKGGIRARTIPYGNDAPKRRNKRKARKKRYGGSK